ncbi:MAG: ATP-binding protein, partial [Saprospiraceae bacterium]
MNHGLQIINDFILHLEGLSIDEKETLIKAVKKVKSDLEIAEFKLERTEKVKRTTAILLEETIDELEQKQRDIEETNVALKNSLEELKAAQAQLIQSEKMASLGELTAGIAHEIQNPLNFVNNFSEVSNELMVEMVDEVDKGNFDEVKAIAMDVQQNLEKINHHGQRAADIVKGMLQHSRTSSGTKEPTDINALADEYLRLAYHGLRAKDNTFNAEMITNFDPNIPKIEVIPQDIGRVILNLITNAFYAVNQRKNLLDLAKERSLANLTDLMDTSGDSNSTDLVKSTNDANIEVEKSKIQNPKSKISYAPKVTITTQLTANSQLLIAIKDNGSGIPIHIIDKIFQPFFTTKPTG